MVNYWLILTRNFTGTQVITNVVFFRTSSVYYLTIWKKQMLVRIGQKKLTYNTGFLKRTLNFEKSDNKDIRSWRSKSKLNFEELDLLLYVNTLEWMKFCVVLHFTFIIRSKTRIISIMFIAEFVFWCFCICVANETFN